MKQTFSTLLVLAGLSFVGCGGDEEEEEITQECPSDSTLTYDNFGKTFMNKYCARCHAASVTGEDRLNAPEEDVFDTLDEIQADADELYEVVVTEKTMPDKASATQPTAEERKQFGDWLACGAP